MKGQFIARAALSATAIHELYRLFEQHFDGVDEAGFMEDLNQKTGVLVVYDDDDQLVGFSTILFEQLTIRKQAIAMVYSGDTIMDPRAWNSSALARCWIRTVLSFQDQCPDRRLYWLLISSGIRTYRFLPAFWQRFFPHPFQVETELGELATALAKRLFVEQYDQVTGVIRFKQPHMLKAHLQDLPPRLLKDEFVTFFQQANPNHRAGDELVCLTEISESNLTRAGWRMVKGKSPV